MSGSNILVTPSEAPTRAVLIDFGRAGVREDGESASFIMMRAQCGGKNVCGDDADGRLR